VTGMTAPAGFLLAVVAVLVVCHGCGELSSRCGQPRVVGEILGGLLLGPSALGQVWPRAAGVLFPPDTAARLDALAQLGLIFFMASLGGLRPNTAIPPRVLGWVAAGSLGVPLAAGALIGFVAGATLAGQGAPPAVCAVFLGLALAITALPVLGRILVDLGLDHTPVGAVALNAAAIGDLLVWTTLPLLLATTAGAGAGAWSIGTGLGSVLPLAVLVAAVLGIRRVMASREWPAGPQGRDRDQQLLAILVVGALGLGAAAELSGLHPAIGAFVFGLAIPTHAARVRGLLRRLQALTMVVLLPLFFAGVGLRASFDLISTPQHWWIVATVLLAATGTKIVGAGAGARLAGLPTADAWRIGVLTNCRGVTELIVATIGLHYELISPLGFSILVLVAAITTTVTGPLLRVRFTPPVMVTDTRWSASMMQNKDFPSIDSSPIRGQQPRPRPAETLTDCDG